MRLTPIDCAQVMQAGLARGLYICNNDIPIANYSWYPENECEPASYEHMSANVAAPIDILAVSCVTGTPGTSETKYSKEP